jgi:hypothetical protein
MPPAGFKPTIPASERTQIHTLDRAATGIGNYMVIICINNNDNKLINNNHGRLQDLIFFFKIYTPTRKNFFEICWQFGHAPSENFASPVLGSDLSQFLNFHYLKYEKLWHAAGSGPRTPSSRAWFFPYSDAGFGAPELGQRTGSLDPRDTIKGLT